MSVATKSIAAALLLVVVGVPILETTKALLLGASLLAVVFGGCRGDWRRVGAAVGLVIVIVGLKTLLPRADIAEAHNAFLVIHEGEALQRELPPEVFDNWKRQFDALYPPDSEPYEARSQWRASGAPKTLFVASSDAIWRRPKYTRQVDRIGFHSLGEFRGGFANERQYNFWEGELRRESMPFYVMYELTAASVGSRLIWQGQVFWEQPDGRFEEVIHPQPRGREITPDDAGKRIYTAFFPPSGVPPSRAGTLDFAMEPSFALRLSRWLDLALTGLGVLGIIMLTVRPRWPDYLRALAIFSAGYALIAAFIWASIGKYLGANYPPHGGGDDGMVHDGWGRLMAMSFGRGDITDALQGAEPVYWFTPGMRYLRMVEKLIFGDTNHLYALLVSCMPIVVFYLVRHFAGVRVALALTTLFLIVPFGNLSFMSYVANAKLGYGEAVACELFLLGLLLLLRTQPAWGGTDRSKVHISLAGAALAGSMFIRPNFALAVVWLAAAYGWASLRRNSFTPVAALAAGLALALWMPFHNWYYGGEFHLISESGAVAIPVAPGDYAVALGDLLRGQFDTDTVATTAARLKDWVWGPTFVLVGRLAPVAPVSQAINLLALMAVIWIGLRGFIKAGVQTTALRVVAVAAICANIPVLFVHASHYRYAILGRDLSLIVLVMWLISRLNVRATHRSLIAAV